MIECVPIKKFSIAHPKQLIVGMTIRSKVNKLNYVITKIDKYKITLDDMKGTYKSSFVIDFNKLKRDYVIIKYMDFKSDFQLCILLDVDELAFKLHGDHKLEYGISYKYIIHKETEELFKYKTKSIVSGDDGENIKYGSTSFIENVKTLKTIEVDNKTIVEDYYLIIPTFKDII